MPLSPGHVEFGFLPNINNLKPGDLILTSCIEPSSPNKVMRLLQRRQTSTTSEWTHAAVYAGGWTVIEAVPFNKSGKGVRIGSLIEYVPNHRLRFRRPKILINKETHEAEIMGLKIALQAALRVPNSSYGHVKIAQVGITLLKGIRYQYDPKNEEDRNNILCSGLYSKCVSIATGQFIQPEAFITEDQPITPAMLAGASTMETLNVGWAKLED